MGYLMKSAGWKAGFGSTGFKKLTKHWLPINMYIGGAEHAVLHLLYVRFVSMVLHDLGFVDFEEPVNTFRTHGLITKDGAKMSKSKGNVVSPDEYINAYGSDAIRMYLAFLAPLTQGGDFRDEGIKGITRFLDRTWKIFQNRKFPLNIASPDLKRKMHKAIKKVSEDIESFQYNTAISALMMLLNEFEKDPNVISQKDEEIFLKLLAPFAPHIAEELYQNIVKNKKFQSIHREEWPSYDQKEIQESTFELVVQVNGRVRGRATLAVGADEAEARKAALSIPSVREQIVGESRRVVFVPDKLINFVI
jgi:leucyl-tRNA synthetase